MKVMVDGKSFDVSVSGDEVTVDGAVLRVRMEGRGPQKTVYVNEQPYRVEAPPTTGGSIAVLVDAKYHEVTIETTAGAPRRTAISARATAPARPAAVAGGVPASMAGRVLRVAVEAGQPVKRDDLLLIFEAMKMENEIRAPQDGTVKVIAVKVGDRVNAGDLLMVLE